MSEASETAAHQKRTFYIYSMPCPRRAMDSQRCRDYLVENGYAQTESCEKADLILMSTCGYHEKREDESVHILKRLRQINPEARFIAMGCLPKINPARLEGLGSMVTLGPTELYRLDDIISARVRFADVADTNTTGYLNSPLPARPVNVPHDSLAAKVKLDRITMMHKNQGVKLNRPLDSVYDPDSLFAIRISTGCYGQCSYCVIKRAVGSLVSKPMDQVLSEFEKGLSGGYRRFVLIGDDTGCYGHDLGTDVVTLLEKMFSFPGDYKLIIKDFNFQWLNRDYDRLKPLFKSNSDKIDFLVIPVQSGSDRILSLMKRPYQINTVLEKLLELKQDIPGIGLDTAMIVGFPTETDDDFEKNLELARRVRFNHIWIYEYSDRKGTEARDIQPKNPLSVIQKRSRLLLETQEQVLAEQAGPYPEAV